MSKHTPGPWRILPEECDKPYIRVRGTVLGARYKVANVITPSYEGVHEREAEETRANARLIAAAPELLEALKLMVERFADSAGYFGDFKSDAVKNAEAAIAKAEGAQ